MGFCSVSVQWVVSKRSVGVYCLVGVHFEWVAIGCLVRVSGLVVVIEWSVMVICDSLINRMPV